MRFVPPQAVLALLVALGGCSSAASTTSTVPSAAVATQGQTRALAATSAASSGIQIDAGGGQVGTWLADSSYAGGWTTASRDAVDTSHTANAAPRAIYDSARVGNFSYTIGGLAPQSSVLVRLHFAETFWNAVGKRLFNVAINGQRVLSNFDIVQDAGGADIADVRSFIETTSAAGRVAIAFTTVRDNATVDGIEILPPTGSSAIPVPSPTPPVANVATYDGCTIGAPGDAYNADISAAPLDPNSAAIIASQTNVDASSFAAETYFGEERINLDEADAATRYPVAGNPAYHPAPADGWPWAAGYSIEANGAGDAHAFVLDTVNKPGGCLDYESYGTSFNGSNVQWYNGIRWPLGAYQTPLQLGYPNGSSAQASGLSMFFGLAKLDEIAQQNLDHAINLDAKAGSLGDCYVAPATASGGTPYAGSLGAHPMCLGAHLRLHAAFASAACAASAQGAHIVYGLQHFGGYESDTDGYGNGIYPADSNTGLSWDVGGVSACLASIHMTDFDVVAP